MSKNNTMQGTSPKETIMNVSIENLPIFTKTPTAENIAISCFTANLYGWTDSEIHQELSIVYPQLKVTDIHTLIVSEDIKAYILQANRSPLDYEEWLNLNESLLTIKWAETGADREMDFDLELEQEKEYSKYIDEYSSWAKIS